MAPLQRQGLYHKGAESRSGLPETFAIHPQGRTDRPQQYGAEPINWPRRCEFDTALLPSLAITAESLLGPANNSLGLKPSGPFVFKHLIGRFAISETKIFERCWG
jgi:hypothetical protein